MSTSGRKPLFIGLGSVLLLVGVFLTGPRVAIDTAIRPMDLPTDLDTYLSESEAGFDDITPGTEKSIVWAGDTGVRTPQSVVYLHGFSASRQDTAPLSEQVAAKLGANLFSTRFTGHGRGGEAMLDGNVNAWLNDTCEALEIGRRLGDKVIVIGVSTGGTAATWLAAQPMAQNVAAFVLISPNYSPADPMARLLLWPWGGQLAELFIGPERNWEPDNDLHGKYWTHRYPSRALLPMMGMVSLVESLDPAAVTTPVLVIYSPSDQIVSVSATEKMAAGIGAERKQVIRYTEAEDPSQHILAGDILSPGSTEKLSTQIIDFINSLRPASSSP